MWEILNLLAAMAAIIAGIYLVYVVNHTAKGLKTGFIWLVSGLIIGLVIHSLAEFLEATGFIETELLVKLMPVLVLVGSLMILAGSVVLYQTIQAVGETRKKK